LCTVEIGKRAVETLRKHDIILQAGFILYDPWTTMEEILESLQFIQEVKAVSLPLFVRAMEIRPGMDLEKRLEAEDNIYKSAPFQYDYRFHDPRVAAFRDILSVAFADLLALYNQLTEWREAGAIGATFAGRIEESLIDGATKIAVESVNILSANSRHNNGLIEKALVIANQQAGTLKSRLCADLAAYMALGKMGTVNRVSPMVSHEIACL
jgi:hypothetical protein